MVFEEAHEWYKKNERKGEKRRRKSVGWFGQNVSLSRSCSERASPKGTRKQEESERAWAALGCELVLEFWAGGCMQVFTVALLFVANCVTSKCGLTYNVSQDGNVTFCRDWKSKTRGLFQWRSRGIQSRGSKCFASVGVVEWNLGQCMEWINIYNSGWDPQGFQY